MTTYHVGRLIDHVHLRVADLDRSARFYNAMLGALGLPPGNLTPHYFQVDELSIDRADQEGTISRVHIGFQARDEEMVRVFYTAALAAGGRDNGAPGERSYHPGYHAAYVFDPDGNNIEAVTHGPVKRSADSISLEAM